LIEAADRDAGVEADRSGRVDDQRVPRAAGKRKLEVVERNRRASAGLVADLGVPREIGRASCRERV